MIQTVHEIMNVQHKIMPVR